MRLADQIMAAVDIAEKVIDVPEWGCKVLVKGLSVAEVQDIRKSAKTPTGVDDALVNIYSIIAACYDPETREPVFERAHRDALMKKGAGTITRIATEIADLSSMSQEGVAASEKN